MPQFFKGNSPRWAFCGGPAIGVHQSGDRTHSVCGCPTTKLGQPEVRTPILGALEKWQELVQRWGAAPAPVAVAWAGRGAGSWRGARAGANRPPRASRTWERRDMHGALRMCCKGGINRASVKIFTGEDLAQTFLQVLPRPCVRRAYLRVRHTSTLGIPPR